MTIVLAPNPQFGSSFWRCNCRARCAAKSIPTCCFCGLSDNPPSGPDLRFKSDRDWGCICSTQVSNFSLSFAFFLGDNCWAWRGDRWRVWRNWCWRRLWACWGVGFGKVVVRDGRRWRVGISVWKLGERDSGGANMPTAGVEPLRSLGTVRFAPPVWGGIVADGARKLGTGGKSM